MLRVPRVKARARRTRILSFSWRPTTALLNIPGILGTFDAYCWGALKSTLGAWRAAPEAAK